MEADSGARRPDMVINLPGGKQMAIDAKVPYNAFMDAQREGLEPEHRQRLLTDHARKVRGHVDTLARKGYWTGLRTSPEFTVAFIPNEQLAQHRARGGPLAAGARLPAGRRARHPDQPVGPAQDGRLHLEAGGPDRGRPGALRPRPGALPPDPQARRARGQSSAARCSAA
ncbi:DNA recombination protein RmuC [Nocardioides sp. W3-2-3]|uniref:DNA recombination protein RmuC n=1 Tax=Nocardioides convexus TaxID=2712224 RepID=UPI002418573C|nr:DNA recombination protein RmuC [Nocardioides convexus]NGZ99769.1 DNA recombination protein RmuC [Nocardioides convexus]